MLSSLRRLLLGMFVAAVAAMSGNGMLVSSARAANADGVTVSEADNGRSIRVARSAHVLLVLHSTYWQIAGSSNASVLAPEGEPRYDAKRSECVPGGGCGTVSQSFTAAGTGRADLHAERKVCGEALACRPDQQRFAVTIIVGD